MSLEPIAFPPHPFWDASLRVYGREGVAESCLSLQDECGCDVNLLLFCGWVAAAGAGTLDADSLRQLVERTLGWQADVVQPLREARRRLRRGHLGIAPDHTESLRKRVQALELEAEHLEQLLLAGAVGLMPDDDGDDRYRGRDAADNMAVYFAVANIRRLGDWRRHLAILIHGFLPPLSLDQALEFVEAAFAPAG